MADIVSLLWVLFAILLVGAVLYVLYNPPKTLLKLRHKESELEIAAPPRTVEVEPEEQELNGKAGEPKEQDEDEAPEVQDSHFSRAFPLLERGNYTEGMVFIRREAEGKDERERPEVMAIGQHIAAVGGSEEALEDLRENAATHPQNSKIALWLALALKDRGDVQGAVAALRTSLDVAVTDSERVSASVALARIHRDHDRDEEALETLANSLQQIESQKSRSRIYRGLAETYQNAAPPRHTLAFAMYELAIAANPTDQSLRFEVAYALSNAGANAQALSHYQRLLSRNSSYEHAANNAGVCAGEVNLPIAQVGFYRDAASLGETLPMANLAGKFISAGFITEARELVDSALSMAEPHRNVLQAMGRIADAEVAEERRLEKLLKQSTAVSKWRIRYGEAALTNVADPPAFSGRYSNESLTIDVVVAEQGEFRGEIITGTDRRSLSGALTGRAGDFAWITATAEGTSRISSILLKKSGTGSLIFNGDRLTGYMIDEEQQLDPAGAPAWRLWDLKRTASVVEESTD